MSTSTAIPMPPMAIGRYLNSNGDTSPLPYSSEEVERSRRAFSKILSTFHFRTGSNILLSSLFHEGAQLMPIERAIMTYGMVAVSADSSPFDARRVESIVRRFNLAGAINITPETLTGLEQLGHDPVALFSDMILWARPGAYEQLKKAAQLNVYRILDVGPAIAMECSAADGVHIDRSEWKIEEDNGEIVMTSLLSRSTQFERYHTGLKAHVVHGACSCGNVDPRIKITE